MRKLSSFVFCAVACLAAQAPKGPEGDAPPSFVRAGGWRGLLNGSDTAGWRADRNSASAWFATTKVAAAGKTLTAQPGGGPVIVNGPGKTVNLVSEMKHGDAELYVEFMIPQGSNSGVYLQGLYEIQVFDSYGKEKPATSDGGAIYHRWIDGKPVGGSPPKTNAQLEPGQWQSFHAWFRAPRFDASGKKIQNARFLRVLHNGVLVQENVELEGPTRAHMDIPEAAENPLMLQGDHGPVAYRHIYIRPLGK